MNWSKILLLIGIILGIFASISLIGVGVFPETYIKLHVLAASGVFGSLFLIIIFLIIKYKDFHMYICFLKELMICL